MSKSLTLLLAASLLLLWIACEPATETETAEAESTEMEMAEDLSFPMQKGGITLSVFDGTVPYPDASLSLNGEVGVNGTAASFDYAVGSYELGVQTPGSETIGLANSAKGQHIHLIVNNGPYTAYYEPNFTHELPAGRNVVLAFLSRSWHESVKAPGAASINVIDVGAVDAAAEVDLGAPHMFYSRPKGTYTGAGTERVLLDFYLFNTELSEEGNKVRATINGETFLLPTWQPYIIEGMPMGENTVRLELVDGEGNLVPGPFNDVTRSVTLTPEAAQ